MIELITDFEDYYDEALKEASGSTNEKLKFTRLSSNNLSRFKGLKLLNELGYDTIKLLPIDQVFDTDKVIVYSNPSSHYGAGKEILSLNSARLMYSNRPCTEYFDSTITYKILKVGDASYSLEIKNVGLVEDELVRSTYLGRDSSGLKDYPMYSIDFVRNWDGLFLACDIDYAVKLGHIKGIETLLPIEWIVDCVRKVL